MASGSATVRVEKATSDFLIGPDWTLNMEICDSINSDHWQAKDVVKVVKKRLQHKNPKVQFLSLTLLETMIKNCGDYVHFQIVEREILQEMVKIVKKKTDMQVRDKILVLLDSWQEAFGGPGGKYPQFYWAYSDLKRSGVEFPLRSPDSALIFTPPVTHPSPVPIHPQAGYGMPSSSATRLDDAMSSDMGTLSISDLDNIRSVMDLFSDMLQAVNPSEQEAVKDEVIVDLVNQCRTSQKRLMQLVTSTGDEELLARGLALNDNLQNLLLKHDAIASGSPLPTEACESSPRSSAPLDATPIVDSSDKDEEEEEDEFDQLARRNRPATTQSTSATSGDLNALPNHSDITSATSTSDTSSAIVSNAIALPDPPAPVKISTREQDMIDLLSLTLSTNPSPPLTPLTPPSASNQNASPVSASSSGQEHPYDAQTYQVNQGHMPFNAYVAPWAQQAVSQPQALSPPQPQLHSQPQVTPMSSSYPPPPWATPTSARPYPLESTTYRFPAIHANTPAHNAPVPVSRPLQQYDSFGTGVDRVPASLGQAQVNPNQRQTDSGSAPKPFIPSYRLFEELIDLRNPDGGPKTGSKSPSLSGSGQGMISGRK